MPSLAELMKTLTPRQNQYMARLVASLPKSEGGLGLSLSNSAIDRAKKLGFDVDTMRYHGTEHDIEAFDPKRFGEKDPGWYGRGVTTDTDPEVAGAYANWNESENGQVIYPILTKGKFMDWPEGQMPFANRDDAIQGTKDIQALGYSGTNMRNDRDLYGNAQDWQTEQVVFDPKNVRSKFAGFNPWRTEESNLLASHPIANVIGLTGLGKLLSQGQGIDLRSSINDYLSEGYDPAGLEKLTGVAPTVKRGDIAKAALGMTDIYAPMAAVEAYDAAIKGDWKGAGLSALGAMPLVGGMIKASHGSPHAFEKFDFSKIGTGEGAQAYGHGGYFGQGFDSPVAKEYQRQLAGKDEGIVGQIASNAIKGRTPEQAIDYLTPTNNMTKEAAQVQQQAIDLIKQGLASKGHLYNVELKWPNAAREASDPLGEHHLLDWDAPMTKQTPEIQKAWLATKKDLPPNAIEDLGGDLSLLYGKSVTPDEFLGTLSFIGGNPGFGESLLRKAGVPGIRYLDQGSRGQGAGTRNYVMFNDQFPEIVSRNGVSLSDLLRR